MVGPVKLEFTKHMANEALVAAVLFVAVMAAVRRVLVDHGVERAPRGGLANAVEAMVMFVRDELVVPMGGHHVAHYTPIFLTYFFFILACNLAGLVPAAGTATGNATIALLLGSSVLVLLTGLGMVHQGPVAYFLHLVPAGTPWALWPLMLVLELVGSVIKCFVLSVRLFANMIAGHLVVGNILSLGVIGGKLATGLAVGMIFIAVPLAIGVAVLEVLVCLIQAYVFTMLAIMFVGAAVHPEH
jgi:F-type H+-transporting ATPase subunit a